MPGTSATGSKEPRRAGLLGVANRRCGSWVRRTGREHFSSAAFSINLLYHNILLLRATALNRYAIVAAVVVLSVSPEKRLLVASEAPCLRIGPSLTSSNMVRQWCATHDRIHDDPQEGEFLMANPSGEGWSPAGPPLDPLLQRSRPARRTMAFDANPTRLA
jgi:hypothetical protein